MKHCSSERGTGDPGDDGACDLASGWYVNRARIVTNIDENMKNKVANSMARLFLDPVEEHVHAVLRDRQELTTKRGDAP